VEPYEMLVMALNMTGPPAVANFSIEAWRASQTITGGSANRFLSLDDKTCQRCKFA